MSRRLRSALLPLLALLVLSVAPPLAHAALEIKPGDISIEVLNGGGQPESRAGVNPDRLILHYKFSDGPGAVEDLKDLLVELPAGLIGRSGATPLCSRKWFGEFLDHLALESAASCIPESQIGSVGLIETFKLYQLEPALNESSIFGAMGGIATAKVTASPGPNGEGLRMLNSDLSARTEFASPNEGTIEMWGIPAEHQEGTAIPRKPLITTSTNCAKTPTLTVSARTWQHPEHWISATVNSGHQLTGCEQIPFEASVAMALTETRADSPTGARFEISAPLQNDADARAYSAIKAMSIALPKGMAISAPGSAGLATCADDQFGLGSEAEPSCPPAARVGSVEVLTDPGAKPMSGRIYLGEERPGERFRLFIAAAAPGTQIKLAGTLRPDPLSGRLNVSFSKLPEVLMSKMTLSLDGGAGALLASPTECGPATLAATLTPYSGSAPISRIAATAIDGCKAQVPFELGFRAGTTSTVAGAPTSFLTRITRKDGEGMPDRLTIALPPGLAGALGSLTPCSEAAARASSCPAASKIGSASTELGPGNSTELDGELFLTGPYRGAPFGVEILLPARIGPYDLGTLAIRGTISLDRQSGQVSVATDPLPREIEGVPVRLRSLGLTIDRPGFLHNPTACAPTSVDADIRSTEGARSRPSSPFRVSGCVGLPLKPSFALALSGHSELHKKGRPALAISGKVPPGNANMKSADIHLPAILRLDSSQLAALCSRADAIRGHCQRAAIVGRASGRSPILSAPLKGNVYAVQPKGDGTPDVWAMLSGQGIEILLKGETVIHKGQVEAKLTELPDFPIRSFALNLAGGKDGLFVLKRSPCAKRPLVPITVAGQNRALRYLAPRLGVGCGRR